MTAIHDYPMSNAILAARVALAKPQGHSAEELTAHVLALEMSGEARDEKLAAQFLRDHGRDLPLAVYLDRHPELGIPAQAPVVIPEYSRNPGLIRKLMAGSAAAIFVGYAVLLVVLGGGA
jgi:hypothetical protein